MARHDALVSGSFVLQFFERVTWRESDLDIFIEHGEGANKFGSYLVDKEGYALNLSTENAEYESHSYEEEGNEPLTFSYLLRAAKIRTYTKRKMFHWTITETKIQIITTTKIPIKSILRGFYSTIIVNVMSWNKVYSVFPLSTPIQHKGYQLKPIDDHHAPLVNKYSRRGWDMQEIMWPEEKRINHPVRKYRRLGDRFTWTIPVDSKKVEWSKTPDYVLEYASFRMVSNHEYPGLDERYIDY